MKLEQSLRTALAVLALAGGLTAAHADQVTLAAWDFSNDVKYTLTSQDGTKTYYTATAEPKVNMEYAFSAQQPYFHPTSGATQEATLTILSSDASKKWYISNYNNGALRMYTASPKAIGNPTDAAQHYNYAEVELPATGYRNLQFSCRMSGNNSRTLPVYVLVSTDGGQNWLASSVQNSTGASWSNFNDIKAALAVDGQASVRVRALIGYDAAATGDMYMNSFKVTAEPLDGAEANAISVAATPAEAGYVAMSPVGTAAVSGTDVTFTGMSMSGYKLREWQDADGNVLASTPTYTTTISGATSIVGVFGTVDTYTLTVTRSGDGAKWGEITQSPLPVNGKYDEGTEVTLTVVPNNVTNFLTWDDNSTALSRVVTVTGDMEVTATFDVIPFIVAWDFNNDKNSARNNRQADYAFQTDNTGVMQFYQGPAQTSTNWGSGKATFGGRELWAARRYTDWSKDEQIPRAYVASFSVKDYDKINIHSLVAANNTCVRKGQLLQLSTTSATTGFTTLKTLTLDEIPSGDWLSFDYELDTKELDGMIYLRWIEDETSEFFDGGNHSGTEGFYLADVIIFADQTAADDTEAPQLVSCSPAEGSTTASARGNIVLSFNERVKAGTGSVTLNGETLTGSFGSKSVTYAYHGLSYGQTYTVSIAEDAITDLSGNAFPARDITFTVMERPQPTPRVFDAVVAQDGSGDYKTIQAAIDAAPASRVAPWLIFVKNGEYKELITVPQNKPFIHLIGQDREQTSINFYVNNGGTNDSGYEYSTNNPASACYGRNGVVEINATDFYTENISYIDGYGWELLQGPQAQALHVTNDRSAWYNCRMMSFQDTWYTSTNDSHRFYANNIFLAGAVDWLYGGGDGFVENSTIYNLRSGSVFVAPAHTSAVKWGYVIKDCVFDGNESALQGSNALGRPWHNSPRAVFIDLVAKAPIKPEGWNNMGAIPGLFAEYNTMDADGNPLDLNNRRTTYTYTRDGVTQTGSCQAVLTAEEAAQYTYENVIPGTDDWNPRKFFEAVEAPQGVDYAAGKLTWEAVQYAICYLVINADNQVVGITKDTEFATATAGVYTLRSVNEYGSLGETTTFEVTDEMTTGIRSAGWQPQPKAVRHNLAGQRVADSAKGLLISNGRKLIVR